MNSLIDKNIINEIKCGNNFAYIINDSSNFFQTEYKVLQSYAEGCFVKCMKLMYNGKIEIYYLTSGLKTLGSLIPSLDDDKFMAVLSNIFTGIVSVGNNGFLSCQNIDIDLNKIFVDPLTYRVSFIYTPVTEKGFPDYLTFENELRTSLIRVISENENLQSPRTNHFKSDLSNGMLRIEDLYNGIKNIDNMHGVPDRVSNQNRKTVQNSSQGNSYGNLQRRVRIIALNTSERIELDVNKDEYLIGKKADKVDGVVSFNKMISRIHCKINKQESGATITDLGSANGTYVNGAKLQPNQRMNISNGDIIRLANSDFQVIME